MSLVHVDTQGEVQEYISFNYDIQDAKNKLFLRHLHKPVSCPINVGCTVY